MRVGDEESRRVGWHSQRSGHLEPGIRLKCMPTPTTREMGAARGRRLARSPVDTHIWSERISSDDGYRRRSYTGGIAGWSDSIKQADMLQMGDGQMCIPSGYDGFT